jgi:glycosyltransferase involved in cell wall biosynthesis
LHSHFVGAATETQWWLKKMFGMSYSFTAHANDFLDNASIKSNINSLMSDAKFVVAVSDYSKSLLQKLYPSSNIVRIYNGMSYDLFCKTSPETPPKIISTGRLVEKKGFEILINACNILNNNNVVFQCDIIGDGPLEQILQKQIESCGLKERVFLNGAKSQDIIRERLARASVFALACVPEKDGGMDILPTVIMEAMGSRLPVVSTRLAGIPEMVIPNKTGLLVEPFDALGLANSIQEILENPFKGKEFGEGGYMRARDLFDESHTIPHLIEMFNS